MSASAVVVLEGSGFSDQGDVCRNLELQGAQVLRCLMPADLATPSLDLRLPELGQATHLLLRGNWTAEPEEVLLVNLLAARLRDQLKLQGNQVFVGIGRGALVLMNLLFGSLADFEWQDAFEDQSKWLQLKKVEQPATEWMGFLQGRAIFRIPDQCVGPYAGFKVSPWLRTEAGDPIGWHIDHRIFFSLVDPLAYAERAQLPEFGYTDLTSIPTQSILLEQLLGGGW